VEALDNQLAVAQHKIATRRQTLASCLQFFFGSVSVYVNSGYAGIIESLCRVLAVLNVNAVDDRAHSVSMSPPVRYGVAYQCRPVHGFGKLLAVVIATTARHTR